MPKRINATKRLEKDFAVIELCRRRGVRRVSFSARPGRRVRMTFPVRMSMAECERVALEIEPKLRKAVDMVERETDSHIRVSGFDDRREALKAAEYLRKRTAELAERHRFTYSRIFIRNQRSRWGSCSSAGNINLNIRLAKLPVELSDYVILHELVHTIEPNHGPKFHELLASVYKDSPRLRAELRGYIPV
ncbi:M48 metallopeptidase family protein [Limisalsivibrio acetivorans]|uniref:M48 metallopeptidase family protein n=1 Tax=Limisalsivibrio acetivorans TaxID=1304888 RepID=UPI00041A7BB0|nr:M48 family metallopeptidase [Limisalsivibrio acetivorans]